jgi:hypothetical protein
MAVKKQFEEDAAKTRIEKVATAEIRADHLVQPRARLDPSVISEYTELMIGGVEFPPLVVVLVGGEYLLVDGYMRFEAAKSAKRKTLRCEVHRGDLRTALLLSVEVNARHGLRRTWEDKRRAVGKLLNDPEWLKWSDRGIARRCSVSHGFVSQVRSSLRQLTGNVASERRQFVSKHGSVATMNIAAIGKWAASLPAISITAPSPSEAGQVVSLSDFAQNYREQFLDALRRAEAIFADLLPTSVIRSDPAADAVLAHRLIVLARKAEQIAEFLRRGRQAG